MPQKTMLPEDGQGPRDRPYGLWDSPIGPTVIAQGIGLDDVAVDATTGRVVWLERRAGRGVLVTVDPQEGAPNDLTTDLDVRGEVGYGGGAFAVAGGDVFFVARPGRLYRQPLAGGLPRPLTPQFGQAASPAVSPDRRWVIYVHTDGHDDCLAVVDSAGRQWPQKLVEGDDFYMQPCWHPDGRQLAYISWNHPRMPWDGTSLKLVELEDAGDSLRVRGTTTLAGGEDISVFQPAFSPDGRWLAYVSDETGWWQIYLYELATGQRRQVTDVPAEHGRPAWIQGMRTYTFSADGGALYYIRNEAGFHSLWRYDVESGTHSPLGGVGDGYTVFEQIDAGPGPKGAAASGNADAHVVCLASGPRIPRRVISLRVEEAAGGSGADPSGTEEALRGVERRRPATIPTAVHVLRRSMAETVPLELLSMPRAVQWSASDGTPVHGLYYPPCNPAFRASGPPPAIISIHGGPTSQAVPEFEPKAQFFTSRGYAYMTVNYRGSTGYGRAYRNALRGRWGTTDVEDAVGAGRFLADEGLADRNRLVIMGGSAGGYTVLQALIMHPGFFRAGLCLYGVANLFTLAADTHKFESRYLDSLVGPLPEAAATYRERSPVFHAHRIRDPIAVFQGTDDRVVPKDQSDAIVAALRARGAPHEYHVYDGEGHGWRKPETIAAFWQAVDAFLRRYVIFS